jgi:dTDP-4-dehydrorhamnose 3,5-epimerase-like enzyme
MKGIKIEKINMQMDKRGKVFEPLTQEILQSGSLMNVHIATMHPGVVRGNHKHLEMTEIVCFSGAIRFVAMNGNGDQEQMDFRESECVKLTISPGIGHAFVNTSDQETFLVCFGDRTFQEDKRERSPLISEIGHV